MDGVGDRVRQARRRHRWSQEKLADLIGVHQSAVAKWEKGAARPSEANIQGIARHAGVTAQWLRYGDGAASGDLPPIAENPDYVPIRAVDLPAGLGGGAIQDDGDDGGRIYFRRSLIAGLRMRADAVRFMEVRGQSMSPLLESGDEILIDTADVNPSAPGIFVLWDGLGLVCKWVERVMPPADPPRLRIISENSTFAPYELIVDECRVIGRVVWYARKL